jgi:hypothetical protein
MAKLVVTFAELRTRGHWPPCCIKCGGRATRTTHVHFDGMWSKLSNMWSRTKVDERVRLWLKVPVCEKHPLFGRFSHIATVGWAGFTIFCIIIALLGSAKLKSVEAAFTPAAAIVGLLGGLVLLFSKLTTLLGSRFTDTDISLNDVSQTFVDAWEDREWSREEFVAAVRRNRKAAGRSAPPWWMHPWFFLPVGGVALILILTPIVFLVSRFSVVVANLRGKTAPPVATVPASGGGPAALPQLPAVAPGPAVAPRVFHEPPPAGTVPGLVACWNLDEGAGNQARDASDHNPPAAVVAAAWAAGVKGKALEFKGKGSYLELGQAPALSFAARAPFTITFWFQTRQKAGTLLSLRQRRNGAPLIDIHLEQGHVKARIRQDGSEFDFPVAVAGNQGVHDGQWHHVAFSRIGDTIHLFIDGVLQKSKNGRVAGGAVPTDLCALGAELYWLRRRMAMGRPDFTGRMDELCIFNRALKDEEITSLAGG